jgi:putative transcriptional regulator
MSRAFASIKKGLEQAIAHQQGRRLRGAKVHAASEVDVKAVRQRTGLTQAEFAAKFAISLGTLRHWERGDRRPRGTALVLLSVIAREPKAVMRALGGF